MIKKIKNNGKKTSFRMKRIMNYELFRTFA